MIYKRKFLQKIKPRSGFYIVAFIDILGQNNALSRELPYPIDFESPGHSEVLKGYEESFVTVQQLRESLEYIYNIFLGFNRRPKIKSFTLKYIVNYIKVILNTKIIDMRLQTFSDTVLMYTCINPSKNKIPEIEIFGILSAIALVYITSLSTNHPIRGGIDIGVGFEFDKTKHDIYGPVLSSVYKLESEIAKFPRIVIGTNLINYIMESFEECKQELNVFSLIRSNFLNIILEMIKKDSNNVLFLDVLGKKIHEVMNHKSPNNLIGDMRYCIEKSYNNICDNIKIFTGDNNVKLSKRYEKLKHYFDENLEIWKKHSDLMN